MVLELDGSSERCARVNEIETLSMRGLCLDRHNFLPSKSSAKTLRLNETDFMQICYGLIF